MASQHGKVQAQPGNEQTAKINRVQKEQLGPTVTFWQTSGQVSSLHVHVYLDLCSSDSEYWLYVKIAHSVGYRNSAGGGVGGGGLTYLIDEEKGVRNFLFACYPNLEIGYGGSH